MKHRSHCNGKSRFSWLQTRRGGIVNTIGTSSRVETPSRNSASFRRIWLYSAAVTGRRPNMFWGRQIHRPRSFSRTQVQSLRRSTGHLIEFLALSKNDSDAILTRSSEAVPVWLPNQPRDPARVNAQGTKRENRLRIALPILRQSKGLVCGVRQGSNLPHVSKTTVVWPSGRLPLAAGTFRQQLRISSESFSNDLTNQWLSWSGQQDLKLLPERKTQLMPTAWGSP